MCVWQSQAPAGTSNFTGVDGCDGLANAAGMRITAAAAIVPTNTSRRVNIDNLLPVVNAVAYERTQLSSFAMAGDPLKMSSRGATGRTPTTLWLGMGGDPVAHE